MQGTLQAENLRKLEAGMLDNNVKCGGCGVEYWHPRPQEGNTHRCPSCGILTKFATSMVDATVIPDPYATSQVSINGENHSINSPLSYGRLVDLVGGDPYLLIIAKYSKGPLVNPKGLMSPGESVYLTDGMRFSACDTGNA
jgi:DNA-directed RNA polymerase subunit RPC12/RpoP